MFDFLKKVFNKSEAQNNKHSIEDSSTNYVNDTDNNIIESTNTPNSLDLQPKIVLLWLLSQKKEPTLDTFKVPKKITTTYNLDVDKTLHCLFNENLVSVIDGKLVIEENGFQKLKDYNCYIIMHLHPEYMLNIDDFVSNLNWQRIKDNDIIWAIFNKRLLDYTKTKMWSSLKNTYTNMATLLIEELKYENALDYIFASSFISTSGMIDNNAVSIYNVEINNYNVTAPLLEIIKKLNIDYAEMHEKYNKSQIVLSLRDLLPFYYYDVENAGKFMIEAIKCGETKGVFTEQMLNIKLSKNMPDEKETQKYFYNSVDNIINNM